MPKGPDVAAPSILSRLRRRGRSSSPLCVGVFAISLTNLMGPAAPAPVQPPAPLFAAASVPAPPPPAAVEAPAPAPQASRPARRLSLEFDENLGIPPAPYGKQIYEVAMRHAINPHLVAAVIHVESSFNPRAVSRKGACGLMQLLPATARRFGLTKKREIFDPMKNLEAGVRYLKWLNKRFNGDVQRVLAAYNAGEGAVDRFGGIPPYRETQKYVRKVFGLLGFEVDPPASQPVPPAPGSALEAIAAAGR